ncbi:Endonuclease III-like protein 1 [Ascosphaera pollenicola]|nr:Endonuclease III-like protein 1 [Ascosphaera pollenicola]
MATFTALNPTTFSTLLHLPIALGPGLTTRVDEILLSLAEKPKAPGQISTGDSWPSHTYTPDYERVLEAYRVATHNTKGAAEMIYRRIQRLRQSSDNESTADYDVEHKELRRQLLSLINLLSCMDEGDAYVIAEEISVFHQPGSELRLPGQKNSDGREHKPTRRVVITLTDARREYQAELDRLSKLQSGDYTFGGDPMDEDMEMDMGIPENGRQSRLGNYVPQSSLMDTSA